MVKYGKPVWEYVLEVARELKLKNFSSKDTISKRKESKYFKQLILHLMNF